MISEIGKWRTGYDSTTPELVPDNADLVFPYVPPSQFAWSQRQIDRFPHAGIARITVHGDAPDWLNASIIDVEKGAFTPQMAREFCIARNNFRPGTATVYFSESRLDEMNRALAGIHWLAFVALWDGIPRPIAGIPNLVAKQYLNTTNYDTSIVFDATWHKAPHN